MLEGARRTAHFRVVIVDAWQVVRGEVQKGYSDQRCVYFVGHVSGNSWGLVIKIGMEKPANVD